MGFANPPVSWNEIERTLSGRRPSSAPAAADGGDSPAWGRKRGAYEPPQISRQTSETRYAELHAHSTFSFLDGASSPEHLVEEAERLGLEALAITDHDGFYGAVRVAEAAEHTSVKTVFGAELSLDLPAPQKGSPDPAGAHLLALARGEEGYHRLSLAITRAQLRGREKGRPLYDLDELAETAGGEWAILTGCRKGAVGRALATGSLSAAERALAELVDRFGRDSVHVELTHHGDPSDDPRNDADRKSVV